MERKKRITKYLPPTPQKKRDLQDWYEGGVLTVEEISKKYGIDKRAITFWAERYGWIYARRVPLQRIQTVEEKLTLANKLGFGAEKRLQKLVDGANVAEKAMERILKSLKRMVNNGGKITADDQLEIQGVVSNYLDDKRLELSYMQEIAKVLGDYAPVRRELTGKGGTPLLGGRGGESKTRKQMEEELLTLVRRLNSATKMGNAGSGGGSADGGIKLLEPGKADNSSSPDPF
jgi:hypothetical protein